MLFLAFNGIIKQISADYANRYAVSSADALSARIVKEIGLLSKAAHSNAVIDWLLDEGSKTKRLLAYDEMAGIVEELYSTNLYVGVERSRNEYNIDRNYAAADIQPIAALEKTNPYDAWYFDCINSDSEHIISIAMDNVLQKKRVWLDYKVALKGMPIGVICTGLEFSHIAGELFSQYDKNNIRGLIVDENGGVLIDSDKLDNQDFLYGEFDGKLEEVLSEPEFLAAVKSQIESASGNIEDATPKLIRLPAGPYNCASIAPVRYTNWSAVILYNYTSALNMSLFLPVFLIMVLLLLALAFTTNIIIYRIIFRPLEKLMISLTQLKENQDGHVYGVDRDDEFGNLANTIKDLFTKANYDALTGIHNRRFMENSFISAMGFLSRSDGMLSVIMIDIDYFKKYNDAYGHDQGDVCLKLIADALSGCITRSNDFIARYGGEEFVAALPNTDKNGAVLTAEKLLESVRKLNIPHGDSVAAEHVTVSVGVTTGQVKYTQNWEEYVKRADEALYMSKQNGRNRYTYLDFIPFQP